MPEFHNGKYQRAVDEFYQQLESVAGLEAGNPEARRWLAAYAVSLGLDLAAFLRLVMALGIQKLRDMGEEDLDTIAAVTGRGIALVRGGDDPAW